MDTLLLRLHGPMQSWGSRSRFDDRDTHLEPTRSGVVGLLCAALGWGRGTDLSAFDALKMGVRVDAPGRVMTDYQTAENVMKANGQGTDTVQSWRHFLADARFLVGLETEGPHFLEALESAALNPVWPLFLGRKSFPLCTPLVLPNGRSMRRGMTILEAFHDYPWEKHGREAEPPQLRVVVETEDVSQSTTASDWPVNFSQRKFGLRRVHTFMMDTPKKAQEGL